jgi:hypothetical protein
MLDKPGGFLDKTGGMSGKSGEMGGFLEGYWLRALTI